MKGTRVFGLRRRYNELPVRGDSGSGGNHDKVCGGVLLWHEHDLSGGAGQHDLISGFGVAKKVGADTFLGWVISFHLIIPVSGATDAKGCGLALIVVNFILGKEAGAIWFS